MLGLVNFEWRYGGKAVAVAGTFNNWRSVEMNHNGYSWQLGHLVTPGCHFFRFYVDGSWKVDSGRPISYHCGSLANIIHVATTEAIPQRKYIGYRAAGIVPYTFIEDDNKKYLVALMIKEVRKHRTGLNFFGGKIEKEDKGDPIETAVREFQEESDSLYPVETIGQMRNDLNLNYPFNSMYYKESKYCIFFTPIPHKVLPPDGKFYWAYLPRHVKKASELSTTDHQTFEVHDFTQGMLTHPIFQKILGNIVSSQL